MLRCNPKAYAQCLDRHLCGPIEDATFTEGSECAVFNRACENDPIIEEGCEYCRDCGFTEEPFTVIVRRGRVRDVIFNFCPFCGRSLPREDVGDCATI